MVCANVAYRLLAIDLDGTLLTHNKRIMPETRRALDAAARAGCHLVIATGRGFGVTRYFCDGLTLTAPQITYNGAVIFDPAKREDIARELVPPVDVPPVVDFLIEARMHIALFSPQRLYMSAAMPEPRSWLPGTEEAPELVDDMRSVASYPCIKVVAHSDAAAITRLRPPAMERFGRDLYVTQTSAVLLEFLHIGVSKGAALRTVAAILGVARDEIIAFGDSHNDIGMLEFAGVGVAMGNADDEVKAVANMVTVSNEDDGIAAALHDLGIA